MWTLLILLALLIISFLMAVTSMKDFSLPAEIKKVLKMKRIKGSIVFFKGKVEHYSSSSSSESSS